MKAEVPKAKWKEFFQDLTRRRFGWETKIEIFDDYVGNRVLSNGLYLSGVDFEEKSGKSEIEICVGELNKQHQSHVIAQPIKVVFVTEDKYHDGELEIVEESGTRTKLRIFNPMPIMAGYSAYHTVDAED